MWLKAVVVVVGFVRFRLVSTPVVGWSRNVFFLLMLVRVYFARFVGVGYFHEDRLDAAD